MKKIKRTLGRPSKFGAERTRGPLTVRLRDRVRDELSDAADASGRSLSEEIEYRLEIALNRRDILVEEWGQDVFKIAESMAKALWHIEMFTGQRWVEDQRTFDLFLATLSRIVESYRDLVLVHRRETPDGGMKGKSDDELADMFASRAGISPPRPLDAAGSDPEKEYARRKANLESWNKVIEKLGSRPLEKKSAKKPGKRP